MFKKIITTATAMGLLGTICVTTSASASSPISLAGLNGTQINALAIAQLKAAGSYTMIEVSNEPGLVATSVTSSTMTKGIRHDEINGHFGERRFLNGVAYVKFDTGLAQLYFGKTMKGIANKWISFTRTHKDYSIFSNTMTGSSLAPLLVLRGTLHVSGPQTFESQRVVAVSSLHAGSSSSPSFTETFYVASAAPFLPVALVLSSSTSTKPLVALQFKDWGRPVSVSAPSAATPSWRTAIG